MRIKPLTAATGVAALCFCLFFSGCVLYPKDEDSGGFPQELSAALLSSGIPSFDAPPEIVGLDLNPTYSDYTSSTTMFLLSYTGAYREDFDGYASYLDNKLSSHAEQLRLEYQVRWGRRHAARPHNWRLHGPALRGNEFPLYPRLVPEPGPGRFGGRFRLRHGQSRHCGTAGPPGADLQEATVMGKSPLSAAMGALALGFCLLFSGCVLYPKDSFSTDPKSIIITGFPGNEYSGKVAVIMLSPSFESFAAEEVSAVGGAPVSGATLDLPLYTSISDEGYGPMWDGTGDFFVMLGVTSTVVEKMWLYSDVMPNYTGSNVPKFSITDTVSTIPFTDFVDVTDYL
jgi:hypothetical protein